MEDSVNISILNRFEKIATNNRLAHAYLFVGPELTGKSETALAIAKLVNCADTARELFCDACPSCIKINAGSHPDVGVIDSGDGQSIKIAAIRDLVSRVQLRPFEAPKKVFVIKNIEQLTLEGSNALLKTLEEPGSDTLLILTTAVPEKNLETVKSRCHVVNFFPATQQRVAATLEDDLDIPEPAAHFLAYFSEGCLGKARRFYQEGIFERKNDMIDHMVLEQDNEAYLKTLSADKEKTKEALAVLLSWFRDLMLLKTGVEQGCVVHADRRKELLSLVSQYSFNQLKEIVEGIVDTSRMLGENLNIKIPLILLREKIWTRS